MFDHSTLLQGWRSLWEFRPNPGAPLAARLLAATLLAVALALGLMSLVAVFGRVNVPGWWWISLLPNIGICLCIVHTLFAVLRVAGQRLPPSLVGRMADVRDLRAGMLLSALALGAIILGMTIGFTIVPILLDFDLWGMFHSMPAALTKFAVFLLFVMGANWAWWRARLRRQQLERDALDARLRLLQGQIEPHLLFNTLANVQSLMDYDPPRARRMLETFSTYLRSGLSQMRRSDSTLGTELEMARTYLTLMQIRMEERLRFRIDASDEARAALVPTLMLQPLVENAIHHGLEPQLDGGSVTVRATVHGDRLEVSVTDDGAGLEAPGRRLRPGAGMALANLRARLQTQFGKAASLTLRAGDGGCGAAAVLALPYRRADDVSLPTQLEAA